MCGIYLTNKPSKKETIIDKLNSIEFRGPDNTGYIKLNDISLGHVRLSILDLDVRSNQPFIFENYAIVFNGEVFNFNEIKEELIKIGYSFNTSSDTEVVVKGYHEWGDGIIAKLNGMFAISIYDTIKNTIFCARDRVGVKPFFYYWKDGFIEICSQLRPLISEESKICVEAVSAYLDCGYIPSPYSILQDVYKLSPGNILKVDLNTGEREIYEYWNLKEVSVRDISYNQAKDELHELLKDAVKIRMQADVPLGSFLSGGIDSALISSIATELSSVPLNTFTIGFEDPKFDESKIARKFSEIIKSNHIETICKKEDVQKMLRHFSKAYDEPFADSSALPSLLLNSVTKPYVTVALSGDGGDESFLGYNHFDLLNKVKPVLKLPTALKQLMLWIGVHKVFKIKKKTLEEILNCKNEDEFSWKIFTGFETLQKDKKQNWERHYQEYIKLSSDPIQRMADLNIKLWLENDSNVKVDRASMAFSLEARSPFLDYRVIEFARSLPVKYRYQKGRKKLILRDILKNYIPESIFEQPKSGFAIPLKDWTLTDLREDILSMLNEEFLNKVPNLDKEKFKGMMKSHFEEKDDFSFHIWKLYTLALWNKEFNLL